MKKFKEFVKNEVDVEFFCCVWAMTMIFLYGLELYLYGVKEVPFAIIFQMFLFSYPIAWFQKVLFRKDRKYSKLEVRIRSILWSLLPFLLIVAISVLFKWFKGYPLWMPLGFYGIMIFFFVCIWVLLQVLYEDETDQLNRYLQEFKGSKHAEGGLK